MLNVCRCGNAATVVRGDYRFAESGLDNVMLRDVELLRCEKCGSVTPMLSKINRLMRVIASALVLKPSALTGPEIRFLRKHIGLTGERFGRKLGLTKEHVSRIENEKHAAGQQTDRLVRYLVISVAPLLRTDLDALFEQLDHLNSEPQSERIDINLAAGSFEYAAA
jgi:transcriptional regulator with XRE-family HTH domain